MTTRSRAAQAPQAEVVGGGDDRTDQKFFGTAVSDGIVRIGAGEQEGDQSISKSILNLDKVKSCNNYNKTVPNTSPLSLDSGGQEDT